MKSTEIEEWEKTTINGRVAARMKEILREKGDDEPVYKSNDRRESIIFRGREMSIGLIVTGVKVGDIPDEDDYTYTVYLSDIISCPEFREALRRENIRYSLGDTISLIEAAEYLGEEYKSVVDATKFIQNSIKESDLKLDNDKARLLYEIRDGLNGYLMNFFRISCSFSGTLWFRGTNLISVFDIINKSESFIEDMANVKKYFDNKFPEIKRKIQEAITAEENEKAQKK